MNIYDLIIDGLGRADVVRPDELPPRSAAHVKAAAYARERRAELVAHRAKCNMDPLDEFTAGWLFLAHYEGFRAGLAAEAGTQ